MRSPKEVHVKNVSWPSVCVAIAAMALFGFWGWLRQDLILGFLGPLVPLLTWILQGPRSSKTGQSLFPPKDIPAVTVDQPVTPTLIPKKEEK